jgi:hypothetical protein
MPGETDELGIAVETEEFTKETEKKFGERGDTVVEKEEQTTDLDDLTERTEQTVQPFCQCGAAITSSGEVHRCVGCEGLSCQLCTIRWSRMSHCPSCAKQHWEVDKKLFLSLLFIAKDVMAADDLIEVQTQGDEPVDVTIDPAATALQENEYLEDDGSLSPEGQEALHVGQQLYSEDADVQSAKEAVRVQEVVNR